MAARQLSNGDDSGTVLGQDASDLIGFHGASPCNQSDIATSVVSSGVSIGGWGYSVSTAAAGIVTALNLVITCLREKGLMA